MAVVLPSPSVDSDGTPEVGTVLDLAWFTAFVASINLAAPTGDTLTKTATYTLADADTAVQFTTAACTLNLPALASVANRLRTVVNAAASGVITIDPDAAETIWDAGTAKTTTQIGPGESVVFCKRTSTSWMVCGRNGSLKRCLVTRSASQTIGTGANTKIQLDSETLDAFAEFDNATNYRWTATEAMETHVVAQAFMQSITGRAQVLIYKNGAYVALTSNDAGGFDWTGQASWAGAMAAGDYIEAYVRHDHGSDRTLVNGVINSFLSIRRTG